MASRKSEILDRLSKEAFYRQEIGNLPRPRGDEVQVLCVFHEDTDPSLSINLKSGLFHCHGCGAAGDLFKFYQLRHGCDFKEALAALSRFAGIQDRKQPWGKIVATYDYEDERGKLLFQVVRLEPKSFRQRRPDGKGGWFWNIKGLTPVPYRLPDLLSAGRVFIPEGEKDADRLRSLGLTASCNPMGAGKLRKSYGKFFQGMEVVILPDNDEPGRTHAQAWAEILDGQASSIKILNLPGLPDKGDVSDFLASGGTVGELEALAAAAPEWARPPQPQSITGFSLSDLGNARRLVAQHGQDLRYNHAAKKWYIWNGRYWRVDDSGEVERRAKLVVANIYREAAEAPPEQRKGLGAFALKSESQTRILAMVRLAQSEPGIPINQAEMDRDPFLFNCQNGTLNLRPPVVLQPHRRQDLITCMAPVDYDARAECPEFEKFLHQIMGGNQNLVEFLWQSLGYALTGDCREQCFFIFWGHGANGKGTLLNAVREIMGSAGGAPPGYAMHISTETLMARNNPGEIRNDVAQLDGPRFVTASEVDKGRRLSESLVKELTGQDPRRARFLYGENFEFIPQFKLFLATNNKPTIKDQTNAIWRRLKLVKFGQDFRDNPDGKLPDRLRQEKAGIFNWLVKGCKTWQEYGDLGEPEEVKEATAEYRAEQDELQGFIEDRCFVSPGATAWAADLFDGYKSWAADNLSERETLTQKRFGMALRDRGFERYRGAHGRWAWRGLSLRSCSIEG